MSHMARSQDGDISVLSRFSGSIPARIYLTISVGKVIESCL